MAGAAERARWDGERDLALAHTTAMFGRAKKLEPLARYLPAKAKPKQSARSMLAAMKSIAAATAGLE